MAEQTYSVGRDLDEALAMAEGLVPYVYEDELYAKIGITSPSLTIGALLMRLRRLGIFREEMTNSQRETLAKAEAVHEATKREWRQHYEKKLIREAESRMEAIWPFFKEYQDHPNAAANSYLPEALRRTIVQEITNSLAEMNIRKPELENKRFKTDSGLRGCIKPSEFIWAARLEAAYPRAEYWWLYSRPQPNEHEED